MGNAVGARQVMVGDNQVDSRAARGFGRGKRADARIHANDQPHPVGGGTLDYFVAHAVALADAVRHMKISRPAAQLDGRLQYDDRCCAVHVVVAVNENLLFAFQCRFQPIERGFHAAHPQRVVKIAQSGRKKARSRFRFVDSAADQQIGKHGQRSRRDAEFGIGERGCQCLGFRRISRIGDPSHERSIL